MMNLQRIKNVFWIVILLVAGLSLAACGILPDPGSQEGTSVPTALPGGGIEDLAPVGSVEIEILESFPVQVIAVVRGDLPDSCTTLGRVTQSRENQYFTVAIFTNRPDDAVCAQAIVPYEERISLDVLGLDAGAYSVNVNGVTTSFTLDVPNIPSEGMGSISGVVWHDECAVSGGEGSAAVVPTAGCTQVASGTYRANGLLEANETGIPGVLVELGAGACPSAGLAQTTTGPHGTYSFIDLPAGSYCVSVDPLKGGNANILAPGDWTYPTQAVGQDVAATSSTVVASQERGNVNFGWDYQFLPVPPPTPTPTLTPVPPTPTATPSPTPIPIPCNRVKFISDVTVPDGTVFNPGTRFTKTWRLQNDGTCAWDTSYDLVFVSGSSMGGPAEQALPGQVRPGEMIDLSVTLTSPEKVGEYRGNWELRNGSGVIFGAGSNATQPFWVDIEVKDVARQEFYNFAVNYCSASWASGTGALPCPGSPGISSGSVVLLEDPVMENRKENEATLQVQPNQADGGWIQGTYPIIEVKDGDRFLTWVGCMADSQGCDVTFHLNYINPNGVEKNLTSWNEKFDGKVTVIELDLAPLADKKVNFILKMVVNSNPASANGFWFYPRLTRVVRNIP